MSPTLAVEQRPYSTAEWVSSVSDPYQIFVAQVVAQRYYCVYHPHKTVPQLHHPEQQPIALEHHELINRIELIQQALVAWS